MKKNLEWIILIICIIISIILSALIINYEVIDIDTKVYSFISKYISDELTFIVRFITEFGNALIFILICLISFILIKNKKISYSITLNLIIITVFNFILKLLFQRPRPDGINIIEELGYSFPSGHSMVSMAFYGFIIYLIYRYVKNNYYKYTFMSILSILIILIGLSRVYLGVHYITDVLAGFLISISYLIVYIKVINKSLLK